MLTCLFLAVCGHLLGKGLRLATFVSDVFFHFPILCPGSGVEFGFIVLLI